MILKLSQDGEVSLLAYLEGHESDIAIGIEDFDVLRPVFRDLMGRDAKRDLTSSDINRS